jgi:16S rRNA G1207 methylase RsmC
MVSNEGATMSAGATSPSEHYSTKKPTSPFKTETIDVEISNKTFTFVTPSGVFSFGRVDPASLLLLTSAHIQKSANILDLGCGWGFIGIAIKKLFPNSDVTMVDINERAVQLAKKNAKLNSTRVTILQSNLYEAIPSQFDAILTNPPMKAGRELCYQIIEQSKSHLKTDGSLSLVALHNRGGAMLEKKMKEVFGNVETVAKKSGFRVYQSSNQIS